MEEVTASCREGADNEEDDDNINKRSLALLLLLLLLLLPLLSMHMPPLYLLHVDIDVNDEYESLIRLLLLAKDINDDGNIDKGRSPAAFWLFVSLLLLFVLLLFGGCIRCVGVCEVLVLVSPTARTEGDDKFNMYEDECGSGCNRVSIEYSSSTSGNNMTAALPW